MFACALLLTGCFTPSKDIEGMDGSESGSADDGTGGEDGSGSASMSASDGSSTMTGADEDDTASDEGIDDGSDGSSGDAADTTAPEVVSVSPDVGAGGVAADANIVITFSETMDTSATEAALDAADLGGVGLSWSEGDTVLTIDPDADLEYAAGTDPGMVVALEYEFSVGLGAADVAGNALEAEFQSSFSTFRAITTTLVSDPALTGAVVEDGTLNTGAGGDAVAGDHADDLQRKGFFSFALADLPAGIVVHQATLTAYQYLTLGTPFGAPPTGLGTLSIAHVEADALDLDAFEANALDDLGVFSDVATEGDRTMDVTANLADDITNGRSHSQYRVEFSTATNSNGVTDRTRFETQSIDLVYLVE